MRTPMTITDHAEHRGSCFVEIEEMVFQIRTRLSETNQTPRGTWFWTVVAEDHDYLQTNRRGYWSQQAADEAATRFLERTFGVAG